MKSASFLAFAAMVLMAPSFSFAAQSEKIEKAYHFLTSTVEGKKFKSESHGTLPSGVTYDFYRTQVVTNVKHSGELLTFQMAWSIKQDLFDAKADGTSASTATNRDRIGLTDCQVAEMKSTNELAGYCSVVANTSVVAHGMSNVKMNIADGSLSMVLTTSGYVDSFASGNTFVPGRSETATVFYKNDAGRTVSEELFKSWTVDPETLQATSEAKITPKQVVIAD
jgi:hypothetical protein